MFLYRVDYINNKLIKIDASDIDWKNVSLDWASQTYETHIKDAVKRTGLGTVSYYGEYYPPMGTIYGGFWRHMVVSFETEEEYLIFKLSI